jgi:ubiquinone/menaquinone biosynthesis C-methylase UbiE
VRTARPDPVDYMLQVARTPSAIAYKAHVLAELDLSPGMVLVDVGCGPGTDLRAMAQRAAPTGLVLGLDRDRQMLGAATVRLSRVASLAAADAHRLPLTSGVVDRLRTDRSSGNPVARLGVTLAW